LFRFHNLRSINLKSRTGASNLSADRFFLLSAAEKAMSLERQVRIAAGSLVLTGAVLSQVVHPWLIGLSGFVGAGLIFAGITDTCGMGMLLARMPWNKVSSCETK
jgi:hypothetical protein